MESLLLNTFSRHNLIKLSGGQNNIQSKVISFIFIRLMALVKSDTGKTDGCLYKGYI